MNSREHDSAAEAVESKTTDKTGSKPVTARLSKKE